MYEAMARRYRPRTFEDVIGQEHVARTLRNAIRHDRVAHAYLFCGPHGCGKTSMARIFARALVCEAGPTTDPCGECALCRSIMRGEDVDVLEIDGASNNGVEQVRALREQAGYVPTRARFKIYIIDEVHMLSVQAFNALLKTLEEPPAHVKFILATTDPHRILETVLSRTQRFDFRLVPPTILADFLRDLVRREEADVADEAVEAVAAFSGGSVRDGLVLLDQLLSYSEGTVTREDVERVRGVASAEAVARLMESILARDVPAALAVVDEVARTGTNAGDFLDQLIAFGRDLMLLVGAGALEGSGVYGPARDALERLAETVTLDETLLLLDVLSEARTRVGQRALTNPLVPLEMAVARLAGLDALEPVGALLQRVDALAKGAPPPGPPPRRDAPAAPARAGGGADGSAPSAAEGAPAARPGPAAPRNGSAPASPPAAGLSRSASSEAPAGGSSAPAGEGGAPGHDGEDAGASGAEAGPEGDDEPSHAAWPGSPGAEPPLDTTRARALWPEVLKAVGTRRGPDLALLHDVRVDRVENGSVVLSVPGPAGGIWSRLEEPERRARLEAAASEAFERPVRLVLELREAAADAPGSGSGSGSSPDGHRSRGGSRPGGRTRGGRPSPAAAARRAAQEDPDVRRILQQFDGEIVDIEPAAESAPPPASEDD